MTEYTLDVSKWRCGRNGPKKLGEGDTQLLNEQGYSCCLGQFALDAGVDPEVMLDDACGNPSDLSNVLDKAYDHNFVKLSILTNFCQYQNTGLAINLMRINDGVYTTYQQKIKEIRKALEKEGHALKVIGEPMGAKND